MRCIAACGRRAASLKRGCSFCQGKRPSDSSAAKSGYEIPPCDVDCHLTLPHWDHARCDVGGGIETRAHNVRRRLGCFCVSAVRARLTLAVTHVLVRPHFRPDGRISRVQLATFSAAPATGRHDWRAGKV